MSSVICILFKLYLSWFFPIQSWSSSTDISGIIRHFIISFSYNLSLMFHRLFHWNPLLHFFFLIMWGNIHYSVLILNSVSQRGLPETLYLIRQNTTLIPVFSLSQHLLHVVFNLSLMVWLLYYILRWWNQTNYLSSDSFPRIHYVRWVQMDMRNSSGRKEGMREER